MPRKKRNPFPGVTRIKDRHGTVRWRYRKGAFSTYLHGAYNSAEWRAEYEAAVAAAGEKVARSTNAPGSLAWLIEQYVGSLRFRDYSDHWRRTLLGHFQWIVAQPVGKQTAGSLPYARMEPRNVERLMARKDGAVAANEIRKVLRLLFGYAQKKHGFTGTNPAAGADRRKVKGDGFHVWTDEEVDRFLARHGPGTKARLAMLLAINTGMSRQDIAKAGWQLVKAGRIAYRRGKTAVAADMPIVPDLAAELALLPRDRMLFLIREDGSGLGHTANGLGTWFAKRCKEAKVPGSLHGLRKAGATRLADAGASDWEIASYLGHANTSMAQVYTKRANRAKLADSGFAKLEIMSNRNVQPEKTPQKS